MHKTSTLYFLSTIIALSLGIQITGYSQQTQSKGSTLNPGLNIPDEKVKELDGAYSIVTVDNGDIQELSIKFDKGKITTIFLNGNEIPEEKWNQYEPLIKEYLDYIDPGESSQYRYKEWHEIEYELKQDFKKLHKQIRELEINRRLKKFYDEEMREWVEEIEKEINDSDVIDDLDKLFQEFMNEIDEFLAERKAYIREMEKKEETASIK